MPNVYEQAKGHVHIQSAASKTWTIVHGLNSTNVGVDVFIDIGGIKTKAVAKSVKVQDVKTIILTFSTAQSGEAYVV